ncbi:hypothetical protein GCM10023222_20500 [Saccharopolyspora cebuensis]
MPKMTAAVPVLTAVDVPAAVEFWSLLGFTREFAESDFAGVGRDDVTLFICSVDDQVVPDNTQAWVEVHGLDDLHAEWAGALLSTDYRDTSGPAITAISDQPWGREFAVRDRAGNCVHFVGEH